MDPHVAILATVPLGEGEANLAATSPLSSEGEPTVKVALPLAGGITVPKTAKLSSQLPGATLQRS